MLCVFFVFFPVFFLGGWRKKKAVDGTQLAHPGPSLLLLNHYYCSHHLCLLIGGAAARGEGGILSQKPGPPKVSSVHTNKKKTT